MDLKSIEQDRFLRKDPNQSDRTKGAAYSALNPKPKVGNDQSRKEGRPSGSEEDKGAPNILTGTVIVACFIQTSALPSRIEMQGNDLTFFDDTFMKNGQVIGDTSRLIFTHGSGKRGDVITAGFIFEKRASVYNTYDNVLSLYSPPPPIGAHNYIFIGRSGSARTDDTVQKSPYITSIHFAINSDSEFVPLPTDAPFNGIFEVEYWKDAVFDGRILIMGKTEVMLPNTGLSGGFSSLMIGFDGGLAGLGYRLASGVSQLMMYVLDEITSVWHGDLLPDTDATYDIGAPGNRIKNIYMSGGIVLGSGITWTSGSGSPEAVVTAPIGSLYSNTAGGATTTLYVKTSGAGNTGWTAK